MNNSQKHGRNAGSREKHSGLSTLKKITVISVVGLAAVISMMSAASDSRTAYITDGDSTYTVTTVDTDTTDIIEAAGIKLGDFDEAVITEESCERINISIVRAFPVTITADGSSKLLEVKGGTVAQALECAGIQVSSSDFVTPELKSELSSATNIKVLRGIKIYLTCNGETKMVYVPEGKLKDALSSVGYRLTEEESLNVNENMLVKSGMNVKADKIFTRTTMKKVKTEPNTIEEKSDVLPLGEKKVKEEGKEGIVELTYKEKYVNDVLVEKKETSQKTIIKAEDRVVVVGTKEEKYESTADESAKEEENRTEDTETDKDDSINTEIFTPKSVPEESADALDTDTDTVNVQNDVQNTIDGFSYSNMVVGNCTAYTELNGITSTGTVPKVGTVAVNPNVIPYGTKLYICSSDGSFVYGYAVAEDTGTAAMAGDIVADLYMNTEDECEAFGRQDLCIYFLD